MPKAVMTSDFFLVGGGIIGICVARELKRRFSDSSVTIVEKERECGLHASSRNSGVLHAGFYYTADSLKAKLTQSGNRAMADYCREKELPIRPCGKLVVARGPEDLEILGELLKRGKANGVPLKVVSAKEALEIEPAARTYQQALFSPTTASVDPLAILRSMKDDAEREGVMIRPGVRYLSGRADRIITSAGEASAGFVVNCAGLYADQVARQFGFSKHYRILPFKGLYLLPSGEGIKLRTHIYPVPDIRNPFLGVHFTVMADGRVEIGPTAIPAFWREQYDGWRNFSSRDLFEMIFRQAGLFLAAGFDFRKLAIEELGKYSKKTMRRLASGLVNNMDLGGFDHWGKAGIRAQLVDIRQKRLVMDFVIEGDRRSLHVLNAVSPGLTCSIPFAGLVCDKISSSVR